MAESFDVTKDDQGNMHMHVPPYHAEALAEQFRTANQISGMGYRGLTPYAAILVLEARLSALESIPRVTEVAGGKGSAGQAAKPIKRLGRLDRCRFGYRPDPHNDKRLMPDKQEQETIRRAQLLRSFGLPLREVCRKLDTEGRDRRGKKWDGSHSVLRDILLRSK